jgi:hypothetical protein
MTFELIQKTKSRLRDVEVLSQKNRADDEDPGAKLSVEMKVANHMLSGLDGFLKGMLFSKAKSTPRDTQTGLDGVEEVSDMPGLTNIGRRCGWISWDQDLTGYHLVVDFGTGRPESNLDITDCEITGMRFKPEEGGSTTFRFSIESKNVSDADWGKLAKLKGREIDITLTAPQPVQDEIDDAPARRGRGKRQDQPAMAH